MESTLKIGVLGTSRVAKYALLKIAGSVPEIRITGIASRNEDRARKYANHFKIEKIYKSYDSLIDSPEIDVIYNPLPNSLHAEWTVKALKAGKHVLCEKPVASNAAEAEKMQAAAKASGKQLVEAFHYRYHPLIPHIQQILSRGEIGRIRDIDVKFCSLLLGKNDFRFAYGLGGGAVMDIGCYSIHLIRHLTGEEPTIRDAHARVIQDAQVDGAMSAELKFPSGITGRFKCSFIEKPWNIRMVVKVTGEKGELSVINPFAPHLFHRIRIRSGNKTRSESLPRGPSTYTYQLRAFADSILHGTVLPTGIDDAVLNMKVIDAVYEAAGLQKRGYPQ